MVPDGWAKRIIGDIANVASGGTPSRAEAAYWNGHIPWVTTAEIDFGKIIDTREKITEEGFNNSSAKLFPSGTILMAMYGQGKTRGKVAKLGIEATTNQACAAILLKNNYCIDFYFQYLQFQYENIRDMSNSGGQENLSGSIVKSIPVPVPPLSEQKKIAQILSTWDKAITTTEKLLANSQQQKKALMQQLLTAKKRFPGFSGKWKLVQIRDLSRVITKGTTPSTNGFQYKETGTAFIKVESILSSGQIDKRKIAHIDNECHKAFKRSQLKEGDILFSIAGALGRSAIVDKNVLPANVNQAICVIRLKEDVNRKFVFFYLRSELIKKKIESQTAQAAQPNLSLKNVGDFLISYPSSGEQREIARALSLAEREVKMFQEKLEFINREKQSLMQQLLTGKRRVKPMDSEG